MKISKPTRWSIVHLFWMVTNWPQDPPPRGCLFHFWISHRDSFWVLYLYLPFDLFVCLFIGLVLRHPPQSPTTISHLSRKVNIFSLVETGSYLTVYSRKERFLSSCYLWSSVSPKCDALIWTIDQNLFDSIDSQTPPSCTFKIIKGCIFNCYVMSFWDNLAVNYMGFRVWHNQPTY